MSKVAYFTVITLCCNDLWPFSHLKWSKIKTLFKTFLGVKTNVTYRKVTSSSLSWLVVYLWVFRLFMKGKFDAYVLWPLAKIETDQKVYQWSNCPFAKMIPSWENHFGKITVLSLTYFLIYSLFSYLAQSQILVISLVQNWIVDRSTARDFTVHSKFLGPAYQNK